MVYRNYDGDRRGGRVQFKPDRDSRYKPPHTRRGWVKEEPLLDLPPVEFQKNFYKVSESTNRMTPEEVNAFRKEGEMFIKGSCLPDPIRCFQDIEFPVEVFDEFCQMGFSKPTPIQAQGWPMALSGRDMVGIAETGSGKTLSFVLPGLVHVKDQQPLRRGDGPIMLVLVPTRELGQQIKKVMDEFCKIFRVRCTVVYGGVSLQPQKQDLIRGVEVLVATPGRLIDLHEQGFAPLGRVTFLVLDEADRMLDMGFEPQLKKIIPKTNQNRQTLMWSATWPREVKNLAESYMNDYIQVVIGNEDLKTNSKIKQIVEVCNEKEKEDKLLMVLKELKKDDKVIIFCNTKRTCDDLEYFLCRAGYRAVAIHGDKSQNVRDGVINDFRNGARPMLIATDVAARGLDVKDVRLVINFDFPGSCKDYVHRIGRTARGNTKEGMSHTLFTTSDRGNAHEFVKILKDANQNVPSNLEDMLRMQNDKYGFRNRNQKYGYEKRSSYGFPRKRW